MEFRPGYAPVFTGLGAVPVRHSSDYSARRRIIVARLRERGRRVGEDSGELNKVSEAIGYLRADVRNLTKLMESDQKRQREVQRGASEHRTAIQGIIESVKAEMNVIAGRLEDVEVMAADSKTVTDQVKVWRQQGAGALTMAGILGTAFGGVVVTALWYLWDRIAKVLGF